MAEIDIERSAALREPELQLFSGTVRRFFNDHAPPEATRRWREQGIVDRGLWDLAARAGLSGISISEVYGGGGGDFRHEALLMETQIDCGVEGFGLILHNAVVAPYIQQYADEASKQHWLPRMVSCELIGAIAMSEPGAGSDLQAVRTTARREGDHYIINGQKTFVTNGQRANLVIVVCKTDSGAGAHGISLIVVETDNCPGFERGRKLDKIGLHSQDTSELFFNDVRVPVANLLGNVEGRGFSQLMSQLPKERLMVGVTGVANIRRALRETLEYVKTRRVFGGRVIDFQNTQFKLAECKTEATIAQVFVDNCIERLLAGRLDAATASMAKYWVSDLECKIVDACLQFFGGYGYMEEYPIARMFVDTRVERIYAGSNEIMKVLIARTL
ncbi:MULTISPECIES: acyl-CoA dehydrogenase family protein [Burkholderia]|uniref:acyl-CoA dehydrogenase family protein n=1 Tax=Burkholderia TaxID=32008 RepID=UPI00158CB2D8|nr:acyl-CoA dehydrogenase family protein [Burkholderia seminalis]